MAGFVARGKPFPAVMKKPDMEGEIWATSLGAWSNSELGRTGLSFRAWENR